MKDPNPNLIKVTVCFMWWHVAVINRGTTDNMLQQAQIQFLYIQIDYSGCGQQTAFLKWFKQTEQQSVESH